MVELYKNPTDLLQLRSSIEDVCREYGVPDPARWLATIMTGNDPRPMDAPIVEMIKKIVYREFEEDEEGDPFPDESEWAALVDHVLSSGLYAKARVPLQDSHKAAQKLMDFLHRQQKSTAMTVKDATPKYDELPALTDKDVKRVKKIFDDVF